MIWLLRIITAGIVLQTLRFKFTGHPESKQLFAELKLFNMPEWFGRYLIGILELIFSILILFPSTTVVGAYGIVVLMTGAMYFHVKKLGFKGNRTALAISGLVAMATATWLIMSL